MSDNQILFWIFKLSIVWVGSCRQSCFRFWFHVRLDHVCQVRGEAWIQQSRGMVLGLLPLLFVFAGLPPLFYLVLTFVSLHWTAVFVASYNVRGSSELCRVGDHDRCLRPFLPVLAPSYLRSSVVLILTEMMTSSLLWTTSRGFQTQTCKNKWSVCSMSTEFSV